MGERDYESRLAPTDISLDGKVAVVTGAANGIGRAIALVYARFGANLVVCDRDVAQLDSLADAVEALGRGVVAGELDVRDNDSVTEFVGEATTHFGRLDVLVNNAGGGFMAGFTDVSEKGQATLVAENFGSVTNFVRACAPYFPSIGGSIVNITSIEAHRAGPNFAVYSAMKAAVANLTKSLALELGARFIRVNAIAPDVIPTPGLDHDIPVTTPLPVAGHVDDVAGAALYLALPLSRFVTGTTIHVDGGNLAAGGWHRASGGEFTT